MSEAAPFLGARPGHAEWLHTADGLRLRAVFWLPEAAVQGKAPPRATVLLLTGRTEHAEKYEDFAVELCAQGLAVAAVDWRGQGLSERLLPDIRIGHVGKFLDYQTDLDTLIAACDARGLPATRFILAHSMGGAIGLRALHRDLGIQAAAFSAPMWGILVPGGRQRLFRTLAGAAVRAGFGSRYAPPPASGPVCYAAVAPFVGNVLTGDRAGWDRLQQLLIRHPELQVAGPSMNWLYESLRECDALSRLPSPPVPAVVALGGAESIVDSAAIEARMDRWPEGGLLRIDGAAHEIMIETGPRRRRFLQACIDLFATRPAG